MSHPTTEAKLPHYQVIYTSIDEAIADARKQSKLNNRTLHIIKARSLFFVDSDSKLRENEELLSTYTNGRKMI